MISLFSKHQYCLMLNETDVLLCFCIPFWVNFVLYLVFKSAGVVKIRKIFVNSVTVPSRVDLSQELDLWVPSLYNLLLNDSMVYKCLKSWSMFCIRNFAADISLSFGMDQSLFILIFSHYGGKLPLIWFKWNNITLTIFSDWVILNWIILFAFSFEYSIEYLNVVSSYD